MLKASRERVYLVNKGEDKLLVEILRTPEGKTFVVLQKTMKVTYSKEEGEKEEVDLLEKEWAKDAEEIEYENLPVVRVISSAMPYLWRKL